LPSLPVSRVALYALLIACLFTFIAVLVQHVASATGSTMIETLSYGTLRGKVGPASQILGWTGLTVYVIVASGLGVMISAITRLDSELEVEGEGDGGSVEVGDD
jgi:prepilin signal peptidase PulO-like enzyme (type II secretory pathway)